jgi:hypothetical protein
MNMKGLRPAGDGAAMEVVLQGGLSMLLVMSYLTLQVLVDHLSRN